MIARLNHWWRLSVTGGCFATYGLGGILLSALVFPGLRLFSGPSHLRARWLTHKFFASLMWLLHRLGVMRLESENVDALRTAGPVLVLANHPTYIDVVALISYMPHADCVVKSALWKSPFFGGVVRAAGYISNDDSDALLDDCAHSLSNGTPLIIFPEGTRTVPGQPIRFVRGAARIALRSQASILPVVINCDPPTLTKGQKWYKIPPRPFRLVISVRPPLVLSDFLAGDEPAGIAARKLTDGLEGYFTRELDRYERSAA